MSFRDLLILAVWVLAAVLLIVMLVDRYRRAAGPVDDADADDDEDDDDDGWMEVVERTQVKREPGYLYFLEGSEVWRTRTRRAGGGGGAELVTRGSFVRVSGYLYFLDWDGNVARTKIAVPTDDLPN